MALPDHLEELAAKVANTGRWGADDERGPLNLIDTAAVLRGVAAARQGRPFSLAIPFDEAGPQTGAIPGRDNPRRTMLAVNQAYTGDPADFCTSDDAVTMGVHAATHWDALAHVSYEGRLYNGIDAAVVDERGAGRLGIRDHDVAAVATDTLMFEVWPCEDAAALLPVHMLHLVDMGLVQGQLWALDDLAADCAADGQHDFLLCATPLPLTGSVGGPVAPTAIK